MSRGLAILELISRAGGPVGFKEISRALSIPSATTARLLAVLRAENCVTKSAAGGYVLGTRLSDLAHAGEEPARLLAAAGRLLHDLTVETRNTALLLHWNRRHFECLDKAVHPSSIAMQPVGAVSCDLSDTPWGWTAYVTVDEDLPNQFRPAMTHPQLLAEMIPTIIHALRQEGAVIDTQVLKNIVRLSAPVFDRSGECVAALALGGTPDTMPEDGRTPMARLLAGHAAQLSKRLGCEAPERALEQRLVRAPDSVPNV